jgi:ABC-type multidrug transport system ATPase subunit
LYTQGSLSINGQRCNPWGESWSAFVPQEDLLFSTLTVRETVLFAALMQLQQLSKTETLEIVETVLDELKLHHVAGMLYLF